MTLLSQVTHDGVIVKKLNNNNNDDIANTNEEEKEKWGNLKISFSKQDGVVGFVQIVLRSNIIFCTF